VGRSVIRATKDVLNTLQRPQLFVIALFVALAATASALGWALHEVAVVHDESAVQA
jgi:hypothetical protein